MRLQQKTALQKVGVLVRAGMMEPPKWYAAAKQVCVCGGRVRVDVLRLVLWIKACACVHVLRVQKSTTRKEYPRRVFVSIFEV